MEDNNEDDLKNKADLHIVGRHTALDISRFAEFFDHIPTFIYPKGIAYLKNSFSKIFFEKFMSEK